ncbi:MAG: nucleoside kinase [Anaerolineae bacterium]|nr:nucleoside kinase [Anaerolineae bacterium]
MMIEHNTIVQHADARTDALVTFIDGTVLAAPCGTALEAYMKAWHAEKGGDVPLAALVNNELRELTIPVNHDIMAEPLTMRTSDGGRIYRRSLVFLLTTAAAELFPDAQVVVDHALPTGAYYCRLDGRPRLNDDELARLAQRMHEIVAEDAPIRRQRVPLEDAVALFKQRGDDDKLRLMSVRDKDYLILYTLRGVADYFYGYMVPSTGYLKTFELRAYPPNGFLIMYPRRESPDVIRPYEPSDKIAAVFERQSEWLKLLGVEDIGALNEAIDRGRARELVLVAEALHDQHVAEIAAKIAERHRDGVRLALIAGPSSSGKTTFSKRLAVQLMAHGLRPYPLAMDHYFVDRDKTPRDANGDFDFENIEALNRPVLNQQLLALMRGEQVEIPHFDFFKGKSVPGETVQISPDHVLIVEGIHGLNPDLVPDVPAERVYRVYVSALTQLNIDRHNRIPTTDVRLLRRMVRDAAYRGYSAVDTLERWPSVRRGEKQWIFPFQENADVMFNTSLVYELAVLRPLAEPLLRQVERLSPRYTEAKRLLSFLSWVKPMPPAAVEFVPHDSLLREFIGESILRDYMPGESVQPPPGVDPSSLA